MEKLPSDLYLKIFCWLDHQNLAAANMVCRKWRELASDNELWSNLFKERWGVDRATFYAPSNAESWKNIYIVQDRCDRVGLGLKIIREGDDYFLVHQGQIQRCLGTRRQESVEEEQPCLGILDKILFFIGDMEAASSHAKRHRFL
ncbi:hypothetical protein ACS0TY_000166 [Phlomoides rotata]